jgi:acetylornithine deacetylase
MPHAETDGHGGLDGVVSHLRSLVAHDTTSLTPNLDLVDHVVDVVHGMAAAVDVLPCEDGTRANVVARFGPDDPDGVVLSGHTDVVPVAGQVWHSDPFELVEDGDRLVARGTTDMKGFIACLLDVVPALAAADLQVPVWLALSHDEEIGAVGAEPLAAWLAERPDPPTRVVVGEPTSMGVVHAHKSVRGHVATFRGRGGHSSQPQGGANALRAMVLLAAHIDELAQQEREHRDERFDPPYTTFNLAMASAGTALNIIPDHAELTFEYRALPDRDGPELADGIEAYAREVVLPQLRATAPEASFDLATQGILPALRPDNAAAAEALVRSVLGAGQPAGTAPFGTDAARFQDVGMSAVVCGPGDIAIAHRPNEWIARDQLAACREFLLDLVDHLATA